MAKTCLSLTAMYFLFLLIDEKKGLILSQLQEIDDDFLYIIGWVVLLVPINWFLEALKWKLLMKKYQPITLKQALNEVLAGVALNFVLPLTIGDVLARTVQHRKPLEAGKALIMARGSALFFTIFFGLCAIIYRFSSTHDNPLTGSVGIFFLLILTCFLSFFLVGDRRWNMALIISLLRYLVFTGQFYLILSYFLTDQPIFQIFMGIAWVFLARSVIPSFFGAIGIREVSAVIFFTPFMSNPELSVVPGTILWLINLAFPATFGAVAVVTMKYKRYADFSHQSPGRDDG